MPSALALPVLVLVLVTVLTGAGFSVPSSSLPGVHDGVNRGWAGLGWTEGAQARARVGAEGAGSSSSSRVRMGAITEEVVEVLWQRRRQVSIDS